MRLRKQIRCSRLRWLALLQALQVDDVLCCSIVSGTDEQIGLLQDEVCLLPLLRVQHGSIPQQTDPLKLPSQQAVTAERRGSLTETGVVSEESPVTIRLLAGQQQHAKVILVKGKAQIFY